MRPSLLLRAPFLFVMFSLPAAGQDHSAHHHPPPESLSPAAAADPHAGHRMPADPADPHAGHVMPGAAAPPDPHAGHDMPAADPHAGHDMPAVPMSVGNGEAPPPPADHAADQVWGTAPMAAARDLLRAEHGAATYGRVMLGLAEARVAGPGRGYRWEADAWVGGDRDGLVVRTEGEGSSTSLESAELQALYSRAVDPYFNLQAGVRTDIRPKPSRTYGVLGIDGLAPYWFDVGAALFVSTRGDVQARFEASYDQLLTQRLILQPRLELDVAARNEPAIGIGGGLSTAELGLRLRYELRREFAPYVGVSWERKFGATARFARAAGERVGATHLVIGIRAWF